MAGVEEKKQRTTAKQKFTRAYNRLIEVIDNDGELDIVKAKYTDIQALWFEVQTSHENFIFAKYPDQEEPEDEEEDKWIKDLEEKFEIIQKARFDYERRHDKKDVKLLEVEKPEK